VPATGSVDTDSETTLATVRGPREVMGAFLDHAVLWPAGDDPYFPETFVRVDGIGIANPAGDASASPVSYCTFRGDRFDALDVTDDVGAVLDAVRTAEALSWVNGDQVDLRFRGSGR
jgi:hypothetical protein